MIGAWVTLGPEPYLATCGRCGGTIEKPPLPMAIGKFVRFLNSQAAAHSNCPEPQR